MQSFNDVERYLATNYGIIGRSESMRQAIELLLQASPTDLTILITGETGTGKEVFANAVHGLSKRKQRPFVSVNCGAIPETLLESELFGHMKGAFTSAEGERKGFFETADKGTIFLDEIGEMPIATQVKLLRILESGEFSRLGSSDVRKVDVRVIAATNRDLEAEVRNGNFRQDLYFRLKNVHLELPPLSQHTDDIPILVEYFARKYSDQLGIEFHGVDEDVLQILKVQPWPGNIRELKNLIETIVTLEKSSDINASVLRNYLRPALPQSELRQIPLESNLVPSSNIDINSNEMGLIFRSLLEIQNSVNELKHINMKTVEDIQDLREELHSIEKNYEIIDDSPNKIDIDNYSIEEVEKIMIQRALERFNGSRKLVADALGISERTLYRKIKDLNL